MSCENKPTNTHTDEEIAEIVERKFSKIIYAGDYISGDRGSLLVECKDCGFVWRISNQTLKPSKKSRCHCVKCVDWLRKSKAKELKAIEKAAAEKRKKEEAYLNAKYKQTFFMIKTCIQCGAVFAEYNTDMKKYCSARCRDRASDRKKEHISRLRIKSGKCDNITLWELFEKDKGVCYICGIKCDWEDYEIINGAFVAGARYPSHDHVIPKSKGGLHTWENARLACRKCNWEKGDKLENGKVS